MNKLYTAYQYLFYKCFRLSWLGSRNWLRLPEERYINSVARSAWIGISFILFLNVVLFLIIIDAFTGRGSLIWLNKFPFIVIAVYFFFLIINYFVFLHKKQYKKIIKRFENESRKSQIVGAILVWWYVLLLFPGCFIFAAALSIFHLGKGI